MTRILLPLEIILLIIDNMLPSRPIGECVYPTVLLLLNRTIFNSLVAQIYHTVALRTAFKIEKFASTLEYSPHICSAVLNIWVDHESDLPRNTSRYLLTSNLLAVIKQTPNLQRLAIMTPLYYGEKHLTRIGLSNLAHLVMPSLWLTGSPDSGGISMFSQFPKNIMGLYLRGQVGQEEANRIVAHCPGVLYLAVRLFSVVPGSDLTRFVRVAVEKLEDLRSLEVIVISTPERFEGLQSRLDKDMGSEITGDKVSVQVVSRVWSELDVWMDESQSTRPSWAQ